MKLRFKGMINRILTVSTWILILLSLSNVKALADSKSKNLYVQVKQSSLRSEPKFWGTVLSELSYGTELTPLGASSEDKNWIKVKLGEVEGYAHVTAVTSRKIALGPSTKKVNNNIDSVSSSLAGKGFNKQVESSYASSKGLDFSVIDKIEAQKIQSAELYSFLKEGKLNVQ